jgi:hypothetical protein
VVIDTGASELIVTQTNEMGQFSAEVPAETPITVTIAKKDYRAVTYCGFSPEKLSENEAYEFRLLELLSPDYMSVAVSGTIVGAPIGSTVNIYGPNASWDQVTVRSDDPVAFSLNLVVPRNTDKIQLSAYSFSIPAIETLGTALFEVEVANPKGVAVTIDTSRILPLQISVNKPVLDGQLLESLPVDYPWLVARISARDRFVGFSKPGVTSTQTGFNIAASYRSYPEEEMEVEVMLTSDFLDPSLSYAYAWLPLETGEQSIAIHVLDSPQPSAKDTFAPGASISWNKIDGAAAYYLQVLSPSSQSTWVIFTENAQISFPRLPDDFDRSILPIEGKWYLSAANDPGDTQIIQSVTPGGPSAWDPEG